jgi:hypothetical protein
VRLLRKRSGDATFTHVASGFRYRVSRNRGSLWMDFEKITNPSLRGKKQFAWFVGSGAVARSYLLVADGFLLEAPVAYYSADATLNRSACGRTRCPETPAWCW